MPAGSEETVPSPVPAFETLSANVWRPNVAVTVVASVTVTTHVPVPEQPPPVHPVKVEPALADAVRVTEVPPVKTAPQVVPQLIAAGVLSTVPTPVPALETAKANVLGAVTVNVAVTVVAAVSETVHGPAPEHAPPQLTNVDPVSAAAVSVTAVP